MSTVPRPPLNVTIQDLPTFSVASRHCPLQQAAGNYSDQIRAGFQQVKEWARERGYDPARHRVIGIPHVRDAQLIGYECCLEVPDGLTVSAETIRTKQVSGGRTAVLSLEKDSATIGEAIGRFFAEYVPEHQLVVDPQRSSYEVYYETLMDYCVPIQ
jgi:DNA gyrase inhibitor GyrI